jgi:hypothetical protein
MRPMGSAMTRLRLLRFMRITQVVLAAAGVLLLVLGSAVLGAVAVAVGVGAFAVSGTDWYQAIYFERPDGPAAPVCSHAGRASRRTRVH